MKKIISLLVVLSLVAGVILVPVSAVEPRWDNTSMVIMQHGYFDGSAVCVIEIDGYSGATISNVDITLSKWNGERFVLVASIVNAYSDNQYFEFYWTVPNAALYCTYRLAFTAEVHRNGTVEEISMEKEVFYTPND